MSNKGGDMKAGDLVRLKDTSDWNGLMGIITKVPVTSYGRWVVLLTSGESVATSHESRLEVISESR